MSRLWAILRAFSATVRALFAWIRDRQVKQAETKDAEYIAQERAHLEDRLKDVTSRIDSNATALLRPIVDEDTYVTLKQRQARLDREADSIANRLLALGVASDIRPVQDPGGLPGSGSAAPEATGSTGRPGRLPEGSK